ncbi:MAG: N-acetylmuramoyl-L-alanine amidase, partial [Muribaculaceae bacterium]|nr:N-acetylmuramoyl-L-alanine amidase [Muribaculaceae bacterium]
MKIQRLISFAILITVFLSMPIYSAAKGKQEDRITIVLDPGHGGKDFGACENGAKEKDINLAVAKKLRDLIEKELKDVKVVMTRSTDVYLTLQQRADVANDADGDLFMSIHVNSVDKKNTRRQSIQGSSVYVLGLHKDQDNMKVAMRENAVIELESDYKEKYSGFDPSKDESYIIFEMAQKRNLGESIRVAGDAQNELVNNAGRANRGVRQAGFWVLWATS